MNDKELKDMLVNSQNCQRNWDLDYVIPKHHEDLMITAIKSSPSKQNERHFKVAMIKKLEDRLRVYNETENFAHDYDGSIRKNPDGSVDYNKQSNLLGSTLFCFMLVKNDLYRNSEAFAGGSGVKEDFNVDKMMLQDFTDPEKRKKVMFRYDTYKQQAIGISIGYLLLTSHMLGYKTCCSGGFSGKAVNEILGTKEYHKIEVVVAVGMPDGDRNRREEQFDPSRVFPSFRKDIEVFDA